MKTNNKEKIIDALLTTSSIAEAAKQVKVGEATIYRYLRDADFKRDYLNARRDVVANTIGQIQGASEKAVQTLEKNLTCGNPSAEIRAAQIILENTYKGIETLDILARLEILEADQKQTDEH